MAGTYLQRNTTQAASSSTKATISVWVKLANVEGNYAMAIFGTHNDSGDYNAGGNSQIGFYDGGLYVWFKDGTNSYFKQNSTRRFRDTNAWYHVVYRFDLTESTASNRIRVYVNNEEITSWSTTNDPPNNINIQIQKQDRNQRVGAYNYTGGTFVYFDGSMSHFHLCDGQSYAPTEFGETDSTTGEWKIKTSPSVTYGNNGFFIFKDNGAKTDQSGNSNNFSEEGTPGIVSNTQDNPSNVFATLNPLAVFFNSSAHTFSNGNTTVATAAPNGTNASSASIGITTGKWYWETKFVSLASGTAYALTGIMAKTPAGSGNYLGGYDDTYGYGGWNGTVYNNGGSTGNTSGLATYTTGDILSIAVDADNNRLYFYKNGVIQNSGTGIVIPAAADTEFGAWMPAVGDWGSTSHVWSCNFGNGYFGTTAVSSAGTNASGNGIFEYDVPTGYTALSTKGLNL